jgi:predicted transcriptional regulator
LQGARNSALQELVKQIDARSLSDLLGYSRMTIAKHAEIAAAPMATYVSNKNPQLSEPWRPPD